MATSEDDIQEKGETAMCGTVESGVVLAGMLHRQESVTIRELKRIQIKIETQFSGLFVDITMNSLLSVVDMFPALFSWKEDNCIRRAESAAEYLVEAGWVESRFGWQIPAAEREGVLDCLLTT